MIYEDAIKELEQIVNKLESGNCGLDEAMKLFDRGSELIKFTSTQVSSAKGKVTILKDELDKLIEEDFN